MLLIRIFFVILIIACIIFYIMYLWDFALVLLITVIAVPVILFIVGLIIKCSIKIELGVKNDTVMKNESFPVIMNIANRSIFPVGKAEAHIEYSNVFNNQKNNFVLYMPVQAHNEQNVVFHINSRFCGILNIRCVKLCIYDPLRLFRFTIKKANSITAAVMPEGHEINGSVVYSDRANDESCVFSEHKPGDDPSEVFDLRGYNPGDKLNRIHWKLSSKKDEFIVKDYSLPIDIPCTLFIDLRCTDTSAFMLPVFDTMIEALVSISQFMLENERLHTIVYYNFRTGSFIEKQVTDADSLSAAIHDLILSLDKSDLCVPAENYIIEHDTFSLSSFVFITSDADNKAIGYIDENVDADIKNAIVVVKSAEEASAVNDMYADVNVIPVIMGKITSSIKDIEV